MISILRSLLTVVLALALSMVAAFTVAAHEVQPAVADVALSENEALITLRVALEPLVAGIDLNTVTDTNDSPLSDRNDALRALDPDALDQAFRDVWPNILAKMTLLAGDTPLEAEIIGLDIPEVGNVEVRRDSVLTLRAPLPQDGTPVVVGWDASLGSLILRQVGDDATYEVLLTGGSLTDPMPRTGIAEQTLGEVAKRYVVSGFIHVIPDGLDHILFVLGLFFFALAWRPLLWQVTSFTIAHTTTLALATMGAITIPDDWMWLVETIIAGSIVWIAVENIFGEKEREIGWGRIGVVFLFGLVHGLGFASVLSEFGLGSFLVASLGFFTLGLEIGHLTVIAVAFVLLGLPLGRTAIYRKAVVIPGSLIIASIGAYWVLNRIGWVGDLPYLT